MLTKLNVEFGGRNKLLFHVGLASGRLPNGKFFSLMSDDSGIIMQVMNETGWRDYTVTWKDLAEAIYKIIPKIDKAVEFGEVL